MKSLNKYKLLLKLVSVVLVSTLCWNTPGVTFLKSRDVLAPVSSLESPDQAPSLNQLVTHHLLQATPQNDGRIEITTQRFGPRSPTSKTKHRTGTFNLAQSATIVMAFFALFALAIVAGCRAAPDINNTKPTPVDSMKTKITNLLEESAHGFGDVFRRDETRSALAKLGPEAIPALIEVLNNNDDPWIRIEAIKVLGKMGPEAKEAVPALILALKDEDDEVWRRAAEALLEIGSEAVPDLILALKDKNDDVRKAAAWALGGIGVEAKEAVPDLILALKDEDSRVRFYAAYTLHQIGVEPIEAVPDLILTLKDNNSNDRNTALQILLPSLLSIKTEKTERLLSLADEESLYLFREWLRSQELPEEEPQRTRLKRLKSRLNFVNIGEGDTVFYIQHFSSEDPWTFFKREMKRGNKGIFTRLLWQLGQQQDRAYQILSALMEDGMLFHWRETESGSYVAGKTKLGLYVDITLDESGKPRKVVVQTLDIPNHFDGTWKNAGERRDLFKIERSLPKDLKRFLTTSGVFDALNWIAFGSGDLENVVAKLMNSSEGRHFLLVQLLLDDPNWMKHNPRMHRKWKLMRELFKHDPDFVTTYATATLLLYYKEAYRRELYNDDYGYAIKFFTKTLLKGYENPKLWEQLSHHPLFIKDLILLGLEDKESRKQALEVLSGLGGAVKKAIETFPEELSGKIQETEKKLEEERQREADKKAEDDKGAFLPDSPAFDYAI